MQGMERWVSMEEICTHLGLSRDTVKKMIKTQNLPAYKIDRKWKFKISEVDAWMHEQNRMMKKSEVTSIAEDD